MKSSEAKVLIRKLYKEGNGNPDYEKINELLKVLIENDHDVHAMAELGGYYYRTEDYDLALKYYTMAESYGMVEINDCLGYIWYYGRTGVKDYKKAYECFYKLASINPNCPIDPRSSTAVECSFKVADLYKNGYYVEKDYEKYKSIIRDLYDVVKFGQYYQPVPEVFTRFASILREEEQFEWAAELLRISKEMLQERLLNNDFFGEFTRMKYCVRDLYRIVEFDYEEFDFYDLYYLLENEVKVSFGYRGNDYQLYSEKEDEVMTVCFEGKWFRSIDRFMQNATIDGVKLCYLTDQMYDFRIEA